MEFIKAINLDKLIVKRQKNLIAVKKYQEKHKEQKKIYKTNYYKQVEKPVYITKRLFKVLPFN